MDDTAAVYTEKSLEMAADYPLHFAAWLITGKAVNMLLGLQDKISERLQGFDRKATLR
jgi:hypothetical protein